jgi:hypothetical protein
VSLRSTQSCPQGGKGYYEVEILGLDSAPQYDFATAAFERVRGVSDDGVGEFAPMVVDGARQLKLHNGTEACDTDIPNFQVNLF